MRPVEERLRPVEVDILRRLAAGAYDPEIARALEMSDRTYRRHVTSAQRKLGARTRAHAVALAIAAGVIELRLVRPPQEART